MLTVQRIGNKWAYFLCGIRSLNLYATRADALRNGQTARNYYASLP